MISCQDPLPNFSAIIGSLRENPFKMDTDIKITHIFFPCSLNIRSQIIHFQQQFDLHIFLGTLAIRLKI